MMTSRNAAKTHPLLEAARVVCRENGAVWFRDLLAIARAELPKIEKLSDLPDDFLARIVAGEVYPKAAA